PKSIALFICPKNQHPSLGNAFSFQGFASCVSQQLPDALPLVFGKNHGMINISASAIMPSQNSTNDVPIHLCDKAGVRITIQKFGDPGFAVIQASQSFVETRQTVPKSKQIRVICNRKKP